MNRDGEKKEDRQIAETKRRQRWPTAAKILVLARPRAAQSVMADLVSSGTTRGELRFVPGTASIASDLAAKVTEIGWVGSKSPSTSCQRTARGLYDRLDLATRQGISGNSSDVAPLRPNHGRPSGCESAQGACRRLSAPNRESIAS